MSKLVKVRRNVEKDARNWWEANNQLSYGYDFSKRIPERIRKKVKGKKWEETKDFLKSMIREKYREEVGISFLKNDFMKYWEKREGKIIEKLDKIHKRKLPIKFINIYYTSCKRCTYGKEREGFWIQLNEFDKDKDFLTSIVVHELMHLYFLKYYGGRCLKKGLTRDQMEDLKEAFTVLMNEEFNGIVTGKDEGYEAHKEIRKIIAKEWKKTKDFEKVLDYLIEFMKSN